METAPEPTQSDRFPGLDGLRALAVTAVFLYHGGLLSPELRAHALSVVFHLDTGVQIFFVLSGFLIYRPFALAHLSDRPRPSIREYAPRRFLRIYPAYWFALGVLVLFGSIDFPQGRVWSYLTLTQTYFPPLSWQRLGGISVAWSLAVEVSFYLFVPLWAFTQRKLAGRRSAFAAELVGVGVVVAAGIVALWASIFGHPPAALEVLPPALPALGLGMLLSVLNARAQRDRRWEARLARIGRPAGGWWIAAAVLFAVQCNQDSSSQGKMREQLLRVLVALFLVVPAVLAPGAGGVVRRALAWPAVAFIGTVSYGIYLWHTFVGGELYEHGWIPRDLLVVLAYSGSVAIATASWYLLERPIMRLARRRRAPVH